MNNEKINAIYDERNKTASYSFTLHGMAKERYSTFEKTAVNKFGIVHFKA